MEELNYPPELIEKLLKQREKRNEAARMRMRELRAADPEKFKIRSREYMRKTGAALAYYQENREAILIRKREKYRLKKLKQKEEEEQNITTEVI